MLKLVARLRWCLLVCLLVCLPCGSAMAADFVVIVSPKNPLTALRTDQVAAIFLAQSGRFPGGAEAVALDLPVGSALRAEFYNTVAARTPALMKAYWTKMVFTGRGQPPRELPNSAAVRKLVADNPAMIAYIDKSALDASVKALQVTP
ncbi:phosphate ABC transporter substrate-binding protein [Duganella sp. FT80W]|uniref:Phosphate ABC transporter substrate-binding protein n=1 Tax=Duganella guangzhouensis TaxID=2666084 RepID=A0A6I2KSA3_9BURK|nr:phosphate ABC transporter substrate-binding protein [Duganella guangzhouensis]MRW88655.1 phosphate ABC transporter substrate-binding protein [Duganella guangzhouensis]